ncbi:MAG TPA: ATP-binding cassette domain-containing protein, partial [Desulfurivibrionaceae bacterium]|nr:ATP-binding cassette domain-containing protein [Desulfurivibrionaceae bacterium]
LLPKLTAFQNIAMPMEVAYRDQRAINTRVGELLEVLQMSRKRDIQSGKLSRGEQQRVAIARAAANSPALLLADEPTGNLDQETSSLVMNLFEKLNREGTTLIIASHDEALYRHSDYRQVQLEHGLFTSHPSPRQLPLLNQ